MSLHGVVIKADGESVTVNIGEDKDDPVFCVTDILPHLADAQMKDLLHSSSRARSLICS